MKCESNSSPLSTTTRMSALQRKVPVLTYHSIDESGSVISTSATKFRSQMQHLSDHSFQVLPVKLLAAHVREKRELPEKAVAITFDDGYENFYDSAYPVLREFGYTATVFVVSGYCGLNNRWKGQWDGVPDMHLMNWEQIEELSENGIDFGSHSAHHPDLSRLPAEAVQMEIIESKKMIEERTGKEVPVFCYPYGKYTVKTKSLVSNHYHAACSTEMDVVSAESDLYSLPRVDMYYFSRNNLFRKLGTSFLLGYIRYRKFLRAIRNR
jgi:peptidoglycan/xylan/chitin deacetylase (PgdA/CDA1 family)